MGSGRPRRAAKAEAEARIAALNTNVEGEQTESGALVARNANGAQAPAQREGTGVKRKAEGDSGARRAQGKKDDDDYTPDAPAKRAAVRAKRQKVANQGEPRRPPAGAAAERAKAGNADTDQFNVPEVVKIGNSPEYVVTDKLGKGGFGQVFCGVRKSTRGKSGPAEAALKFEHKSSKGCTHGKPYEWHVYSELGDCYGIPKAHYKGSQDEFFILIMDVLGPSLWDVCSKRMSVVDDVFVACVAMESLAILEQLHRKGYVHGDVKPENFLMGKAGSEDHNRLFLVDLGLATRWNGGTVGQHVSYDQKPDDFRGTIRYASVHAHLGRTASRRDDLESLAYMLVFMLKGRLPWQGYQGADKGYWVCKKKMQTPPDILCGRSSDVLVQFTRSVYSLAFDEEPPYGAYTQLFSSVVQRHQEANLPLCIDGAKALLQRRGHEVIKDEYQGAPRRRIRTGWPTSQWITVYNKFEPMKQRYHYNVGSLRLDTHISKGFADGLTISSVACYMGLWAVIMDVGTGYSGQTYILANEFLPKAWIMERWEEGYYITAVAGDQPGGVAASAGHSCMVVMSRGTRYTQQSYKISDTFPYEWIKKKWREGFHVTSMGTHGATWAVVMSRNAGFYDQCVELDFQYPSEGIHYRWDAGYRITALAATSEEAAYVLSVPRKRPLYETQETMRTSTFPSTHVRQKWARDLYVAGVAFGRTVS
ncbi:unnamed protein product [Pedinophyceae sp. YPF-701]|nr:unnamed protein product [Pedinophyceae sp. YPF-701]